MIYCLAVFHSRTHTIGFIKYMRAQGIDCVAVNTPSEINIGCGISAKFPIGHTAFARQVISALSLSSHRGLFSLKKVQGKVVVTRL